MDEIKKENPLVNLGYFKHKSTPLIEFSTQLENILNSIQFFNLYDNESGALAAKILYKTISNHIFKLKYPTLSKEFQLLAKACTLARKAERTNNNTDLISALTNLKEIGFNAFTLKYIDNLIGRLEGPDFIERLPVIKGPAH